MTCWVAEQELEGAVGTLGDDRVAPMPLVTDACHLVPPELNP